MLDIGIVPSPMFRFNCESRPIFAWHCSNQNILHASPLDNLTNIYRSRDVHTWKPLPTAIDIVVQPPHRQQTSSFHAPATLVFLPLPRPATIIYNSQRCVCARPATASPHAISIEKFAQNTNLERNRSEKNKENQKEKKTNDIHWKASVDEK